MNPMGGMMQGGFQGANPMMGGMGGQGSQMPGGSMGQFGAPPNMGGTPQNFGYMSNR